MPGCRTTTAIKKLSNHIIVVHNIRDKTKRRKLLLEAKDQGPQKPELLKIIITIGEAFQRQKTRDTASNRVVIPIVAFIENLTSFNGGK